MLDSMHTKGLIALPLLGEAAASAAEAPKEAALASTFGHQASCAKGDPCVPFIAFESLVDAMPTDAKAK